MKVFLTGATGFLGEYVMKQLLNAKYNVRALARNPQSLEHIKGIETVQGDVTIPDTLKGKMAGCDAVIHLAGAVGYGQTFDNCRSVNIDGTLNVAEEAVTSGIRRFIHCSSVSVYGRVPEVRLSEEAQCLKINDPYGDTKIDAEIILKQMEDRLDLTIFRPTVIYGKGDHMFLPQLAAKIKAGKFKIIGRGLNRLTLIHAEDTARAIVMALDKKIAFGKIYNLSNTDNLSINELAELIAETVGYRKSLKHIPYGMAITMAGLLEFSCSILGKKPPITRFAVRILGKQYNYSTDAVRTDLGFKPEIDIRRGIVETLK